MADSLITNLTNVSSPTGAEEVPVNVPGSPDTDGKVVLSALAAYVESTLGNAAGLDVGTTTGTVAAGDDSRLSDARTPTSHASTHTNGTDDIQDATSSQKGLMTAAYATKLDGIEAAADVTDATNVAAAGALMTSALGTGVATALGVNVGSAGAPVVNGGALGTPSSGALTNCTGLPISTGVSGLGSGVATALAIAPNTTGGFATYPVSGGGGSEPSFVLKTDTASTASSTFSDITDLSITFSASSASQKITLRAVLYVGSPSTCDDQFVFENEDGVILQGSAAGSRLQSHGYLYNPHNNIMGCVVMEAVYTPGTTSSRTYKVRWKRTGTGTIYLNRCITDTDSASFSRTASSFILQPH